MPNLIDTNVLVYRHDPRFPEKREVAARLLRNALGTEKIVLPHQALLEFVSVTTRPRSELGGRQLLEPASAYLAVERLLAQFPVVFPTTTVLVTAMRGAATYQLSWYDAHLWAYAEVYGLDELLSEDFQHGRRYGSVRVRNPFLEAADEVNELPALYRS